MAKLFLEGAAAKVELTSEPIEGGVVATCVDHGILAPTGCRWSETYDDMNDATEYASDHADRGVR